MSPHQTYTKSRKRNVLSNFRRGFTLLEITLAALLSSIIALAVFGALMAMQRADASSAVRTNANQQMSSIHRTFQRAFRSMLLDRPRSIIPGAPADASGVAPPAPRVILSDGQGDPQLEMTLTMPPILGLIDGKPMSPTAKFSPIRGLIELREGDAFAQAGPTRRSAKQADAQGNTQASGKSLWFVPIDNLTGEPMPKGLFIAEGIAKLSIKFAKTDDATKRLVENDSWSITDPAQVPAYALVNLEMESGQTADWIFEVAFVVGREPGTESADDDLPSALVDRIRQEEAQTNPESNIAAPVVNPKPADNPSSTSGLGENPNNPTQPRRPRGPQDWTPEERQAIAEALQRMLELMNQLYGGGQEEPE